MTASPAIDSLKAAAEWQRTVSPAPEWLQELKSASLSKFLAAGFPTQRAERWKYTRLASFARKSYALPGAQGGAGLALPAGAFRALEGPRLVFIDGCLHEGLSDTGNIPGLRITNLETAIGEDNRLVREQLGRIADGDLHQFTRLNLGLLGGGAVIEVDRGVEIRQPLYLLFMSQAADAPLVANPRILFRLGERSSIKFVEHHIGEPAADNLVNLCGEGIVGQGATLEYYAIHEDTGGSCGLSSLHLRQAGDSLVRHNSVSLGGRMIRNDVHSRLEASGASIELHGLYLAGDRQHVDNHTLVEHCAPHTTSSQDYKGVLQGRGRAVFNGKVLIHEGAHGSNAQQSNSNLLLSGQAEVDTKPELEIYNDDVKCSHGATVGQLDKQALYYLRSRGIGEETARVMLTFAFAEAVIQKMAIAQLRERIEENVIRLLPASERIRTFL